MHFVSQIKILKVILLQDFLYTMETLLKNPEELPFEYRAFVKHFFYFLLLH